MGRVAALFAACLAAAYGEAPANLENNGKPMRVALACQQELLQPLGLTCSEDEPCPLYLELSAIGSTGVRVFVAGNIHTNVLTVSSILLGSADGGKTWTEAYERIPYASLEQMQFLGLGNGWISGSVIQTLPRDPFFLLTTDGGKSWKRQPVFEDSHDGSVEKFSFESATSGTAIVSAEGGKYELLDTMTGGDSWALKQVSSTPLTLGRAAAANAGWRLRTDAKSRSYDVESREGNGWQRIASFAVNIGACK